MNLIYLSTLVLAVVMTRMAAASSRSVAHTVVVEPSEDPFLDPYIEQVLHMNVKDIVALPKLNDFEFLQYFHRKDRIVTRSLTPNVDTSIFDPLRDDQLAHQTDIDKEWETLMVAGPMVVGYIGSLMVLSSKQDFPFKAPANYTYRHIKYSNSFRATLVQTSTDMYNALMGAHTAMDKIQLAIKQVPTHVRNAMKLISSASDAMLKSMLPRTLESIGRLATESAETANSTLLRFNQLQDLLAEIVELSASTQSTNEADIEQMQRQIKNGTLEEDRLKKNLAAVKEQYNQSKIALADARRDYADAMRKLKGTSDPNSPSDAHLIVGLITTAINVVFNPVGAIGNILGSLGGPQPKVDNTKFENAMNITQVAKARLEEAEKIHNEHFQIQLAEQNELARTINAMALLDMNVLSTEEIIRLLLEATKQIYEIRQQWARMIQFFSKLAAQAYTTQQVVVNDFVVVIQQAQNDNLLVNPIDREFFVEFLVPAATTIESGAHLLYTMATTYYAISKEYMIDQVAGIGKMTLLQTNEERTAQLRSVSNSTLNTSFKVTQLAQERHASYIQLTHARQAQYETYIQSLENFQITNAIARK